MAAPVDVLGQLCLAPDIGGTLTEYPQISGKGLGGSSGINFMSYAKPPARDIAGWRCTSLRHITQ